MIPESRKDEGLMLGRPVRENVSLASLPALSRFGFVRRRAENDQVRDALRRGPGASVHRGRPRRCPAATSRSCMFARALLARAAVLSPTSRPAAWTSAPSATIYELLAELAATASVCC